MKMVTEEQKRAIQMIAQMAIRWKRIGYDYVDDSVEIRLYGKEKEIFEEAVEDEQHPLG